MKNYKLQADFKRIPWKSTPGSRAEQDCLDILDLVHFDVLVTLLVGKKPIRFVLFLSPFKIFDNLSHILIFLNRLWYVILVSKEIKVYFWIANMVFHWEQKFVEWVINASFPRKYCQNSLLIVDISSLKILNRISPFLPVFKKRILKYLDVFLKR